MRILTADNKSYELDQVPDEVEDLSYSVLDCSDNKNIDFFYSPLVFLESFHSPAAVLKVGKHVIQMPLDWSVLVCDEEFNDIEIMPLTSLNDRGFRALSFNPYTVSYPTSDEISLINVYADVKWFFPKLKPGCILSVPLTDGENPKCAYFVKELNKVPRLEVSDLV